ncbi:hypothetical protein EVAR_80055_1 [Eumeta japonica]|uniref:Uncharacterized protein n=1 Tax=Eumeta variegata TaxID=151549 RepID=A0A4C1WM87_EUMVA|nr:hypothetical protein EVAR_80055_1 [Eumeta japonica]
MMGKTFGDEEKENERSATDTGECLVYIVRIVRSGGTVDNLATAQEFVGPTGRVDVVGKQYTKIMNERIVIATENEICDGKMGFRKGTPSKKQALFLRNSSPRDRIYNF